MKHWLLLILVMLSGSINAAMPELALRKNDQTIKVFPLNELVYLKNGAASLTVDNPTDSKYKTYQGILLTALLDQVFGNDWKQFDAIKFIAEDGYNLVIPTTVVRAHTGMIATGERGIEGFSRLKRENADSINPGPFFLVWENIKDTIAKQEHWLGWPWQLSAIELTSFAKEYPHSAPPDNSNNQVKQGFLDFQQHCMKCHSINGDGGSVGLELNYPVNVTEYWQEQWLTKFIANPQSIRANSKMIAFYRDVENREALIASIMEYLKAMVDKKIAPSIQK
jgi:cytochrome c2